MKQKRSKNLTERLAAVEQQAAHEDATKRRPTPPGWQPGVVWDGDSGTITTGSLDAPPACDDDWSELLTERGLDPSQYTIVSDTIKWTSYDGWKRDSADEPAYSALCFSFRAEIKRKSAPTVIPEDLYIAAAKAKPQKTPNGGPATFVVALSDWQLGNCDGGGIDEQVAKIAALPGVLSHRLKALRKAGTEIGSIAILGLGDLCEGTCGFYPAQKFRVQADRREQIKLVRRGLRDIVMAMAPLAPEVVVAAVPGNHGENRDAGKSYTSPGDNDDVAVFEQVAEILSVNPEAFGHVGFRLPLERIAISLSLGEHIVALTHGHVPRPSGGAANAMWNWWKDQSHGRAYPGVADADFLIAGHFHHLNIKEQEGRTLIVCPSLTRVGDYFQDQHGVMTRPGTLTFVLSPDGWSDLSIL